MLDYAHYSLCLCIDFTMQVFCVLLLTDYCALTLLLLQARRVW
jgi:hypothetical protein